MRNLVNKVQLSGHVGATPETKTFENGNSVTTFTLATNEGYKNKAGEWVNETTWHNIKAWGVTGKIADEKLQKGDKAMVSGKITNRSYEDKNGQKRYITEIVIDELMLISKKEATQYEEKADMPF